MRSAKGSKKFELGTLQQQKMNGIGQGKEGHEEEDPEIPFDVAKFEPRERSGKGERKLKGEPGKKNTKSQKCKMFFTKSEKIAGRQRRRSSFPTEPRKFGAKRMTKRVPKKSNILNGVGGSIGAKNKRRPAEVQSARAVLRVDLRGKRSDRQLRDNRGLKTNKTCKK